LPRTANTALGIGTSKKTSHEKIVKKFDQKSKENPCSSCHFDSEEGQEGQE
jgi:hypothetical protein